MNRLIALGGALALAVFVTGAGARADDKETLPEIGDIMPNVWSIIWSKFRPDSR